MGYGSVNVPGAADMKLEAMGEIEKISGEAAPTESTVGIIGQKYTDTSTDTVYTCIATVMGENGETRYTWVVGSLGTLAEIRAALHGVSAALSQKVPILQTVPSIYLYPSDMVDSLINDGAIKLSKIGNIVTVNLNVKTATELNYNKVFAIIPEGYRPQTTATFPLCDGHGNALYGAIQENGECKTYNAAAEESYLSAAITYFVDSL